MLGHNNPPATPDPTPDYAGMRYYAWKKAHRAAFRAPSVQQMKIRTERANAVGLTYKDFTATLLDRGRNLTTLIFGLKGVLARRLRLDMPMPGVREKLKAIRPEASFVIEQAEGETIAAALRTHIARFAALCAFPFTAAHVSANEPLHALAQEALTQHERVPAEAILVGDDIAHERAAELAKLGRFIWSWRYFAD